MSVDDSDNSIMHFDWIISKNVTMAIGKLAFLVCIKKVDLDGNEVNHWNSELYKSAIFLKVLNMTESHYKNYIQIFSKNGTKN